MADQMLALAHAGVGQRLIVEAGWKPARHVQRIVDTLHGSLLESSRG